MEGNSRFKIDWASLIVRRKFFFFLYFSLCSRAISKYKPPGVLYLEGRFNGGFFALPVWGAYIWRGLYMEGLIFGILRYYGFQSFFYIICPCRTNIRKLSIDLFTDTASILNLFDLRSIIGCPGGMSTFRLYFRALFETFFF